VEAGELLRVTERMGKLRDEKEKLVERLREQEEELVSRTNRLAGLIDTLAASSDEVVSLRAALQLTSQQLKDTQSLIITTKSSISLPSSRNVETEIRSFQQQLQVSCDLYASAQTKIETLEAAKAAFQASIQRAEEERQRLEVKVRDLNGVTELLMKARQRRKEVESAQGADYNLEKLRENKAELERRLRETKEKVSTGSQLLSTLIPSPSPSLTLADNESQWQDSLGLKRGLLYRDKEVEAGYRAVLYGLEGTVLVYVVNRSKSRLEEMEVEPETGKGYALTVALRKVPQDFDCNAQADIILSFSCFKPFLSTPMLRLSYLLQANKRQLLLRLPLTCADLIRPLALPATEINTLWNTLENSEIRKELRDLERFTLEDIKELAQFRGSFCCVSRQEASFLDASTFLTCGQLQERPVLSLFRFTSVDSCQLAVRCASRKLRVAVLQTMEWQFSSKTDG
jgi:hypothetical protein